MPIATALFRYFATLRGSQGVKHVPCAHGTQRKGRPSQRLFR
jgi:hypothetical protein